MTNTTIYFNGQFIKADHAFLESITPGRMTGQGVFETMCVEQGVVIAFEEHYHRLSMGIKFFGLQPKMSPKGLKKNIESVLRLNQMRRARVRVAVWKDRHRQKEAIVCAALKKLTRQHYQKGYKAVIYSEKRKPPRYSYLKSIDYGFFREAYVYARKNHYEEALIVNHSNELTEGAISNVFMVKDNVIYTPRVRCGCLNGITRQRVIQQARADGLKVKAASIHISELKAADEMFLTNSLFGIMPLIRVSRKNIAAGIAGPVSLALFRIFHLPNRG